MARPVGTKGKDTSERIKACSLRLFARSGYAAVSMREIALAAGVAPAAIYNHFATKQHILLAILHSHMTELLSAFEKDRPAPSQGAIARLQHFVCFHIDYHSARPDQVFLSYMELRALEAENFQLIEALRRDYEAHLKAILTAGHAEQSMRACDIHVTAMAILAMLTGISGWFRERGRLSQTDIQTIYTDLVLRAAGADHQPVTARSQHSAAG